VADDKITVQLVIDKRKAKSTVQSLERDALNTGNKISVGLSKALSRGFTNSIANFRNQLLGLGAAFLGFQAIRGAIQSITSFDQALREINTLLPATEKLNDDLKRSFIELSQQFGTTATEQAKSFYQIISAGITDAREANDLLIQANKLAVGGLSTTAGAIDILTGVINAFGRENISASNAADILFGTVRLGKTRIEELQTSLGLVLPTAAALGVSFEEVAGTIAQLTTKSISTSEATTRLNAIFTAILKSGNKVGIVGREIADAFSLTALRTKGLTQFLIDLKKATRGSEETLIKLTGRAEAASAILALAGDNFEGLSDKIDQLRNSAGASEAAFRELVNSIAFQTDRLVSNFRALVLNITFGGEEEFADGIKRIADSIEEFTKSFNTNIKVLQARLVNLGIFVAAAFFGPQIKAAIVKLLISMKSLSIQTLAVGRSFLSIKASGVNAFRSLTIAVKVSNLAMKLLTISVKILQVTLTLGLFIIIDRVITKFIELNEESGKLSRTFKLIGLNIKVTILGVLELLFQKLADLATKIPAFGKKLSNTFREMSISVSDSLTKTLSEVNDLIGTTPGLEKSGQDIKKFGDDVVSTTVTVNTELDNMRKNIANSFMQLRLQFPLLGQVLENFGFTLESLKGKTKQELAQIGAEFVAFKQLAQDVTNTALNGLSQGFQALGAAIATGGNGFQEFGKIVLKTIGQMAITIGNFLIAVGIGMNAITVFLGISGAAAIAAGIALNILGGALIGAAGGGGVSSAAPAGPTGGGIENPAFTQPIELQDVSSRDPVEVAINIQGDVFDRRESGLAIAEVLEEFFDTQDGVIAKV